ncbi:MAG: OmpA family protein [Bacteroidales bacterium]|jgi:outer membrane protein OmpA-like peptidoglycan-associated protein/outer membrane protein assembly factor BamD (BamD/ComL family)
MKFKILLLSLLLIISGFAMSQSRLEGRLKKTFSKAVTEYQKKNYATAMKYVDEIISKNADIPNVWMLKGDIYFDNHDFDKAVNAYERTLKIDSANFKSALYMTALSHFNSQNYKDAKLNFQNYLNSNTNKHYEISDSKKKIPICTFRDSIINNALPVEIVNIGRNVNTEGYEYVNALSLDGRLMYFTRKGADKYANESFFKSYSRTDADGETRWQTALEIGYPINTDGNEGALCVSPDGITIIITCCSRIDSYGSCDLYFSNKDGKSWTEPINLGRTINSRAWESQPSFAADGKTLYFVSNRAGGVGGADIYVSKMDDKGYWSEPKNLGNTINTKGDEFSPHIHPDGKTLYFSSDGHMGMGQFDLFVTELQPDGTWSKPVNLGYPINTNGDEINIILNAAGDYAYMSAQRADTYGNTDIYRVKLPEYVRPEYIAYIKGKVIDKKTREPLLANFEVIDMQKDSVVVSSWSDKVSGEFIFSLPVDKSYALNVNCKGYLFYSHNFTPQADLSLNKDSVMIVELNKIVKGEKTTLRNIFFEYDKYDLLPESEAELNKLLLFLNNNSSVKIQIVGHTDDVGSEEYNLKLSENRAKAVYQFLIDRNIDSSRISYKGMGEQNPIYDNSTEEGRAMNRRTEFVVIE